MRKINYIGIVFLWFGVLSCDKKEYPESSVENEAVFYMQGTVDYNPVDLAAGKNDYYMYSSYSRDSNSVFSFAGELKQINCNDCRSTLEVRIRDYKPATGGVPNPVDSSLKSGKYLYIDRSTDMVHHVSFEGSYKPVSSSASVKWDFGDGTTSTDLNPTHTFKTPGKYPVCLTVEEQNGCQGSICNDIQVGNNAFVASVKAAITGDRAVLFAADVFGTPPYKYLWNFGDGSLSSAGAPLHIYKYDGSYPVTLTITDANNQTVVSCYHVVTSKDLYSCVPNTKVTAISSGPSMQTAGVVLKWTDASGVIYTTDKTPQTATSFFEIEKVENYSMNERMQKTKKLHIRFNCVMSNGKRAIPFNNARGVICVAIP